MLSFIRNIVSCFFDFFTSFGLTNYKNIPVVESVSFNKIKGPLFNYAISYLYKECPVPREYAKLPPDETGNLFWFKLGNNLPNKFDSFTETYTFMRGTLSLMCSVDKDFGDKAYNHSYCLLALNSNTREWVNSLYVRTDELSQSDFENIIAVSLETYIHTSFLK